MVRLLNRSLLSSCFDYFLIWLVVGLDRIELSTSPLPGVRSRQLSYRPILKRLCNRPVATRSELVELVGIEPATS